MLVLASSSPRRRDLLMRAGIDHIVKEPLTGELKEGEPSRMVIENARRKALSVESGPGDLVMGCDTVVSCSGRILGKPSEKEEARSMILMQIDVPARVFSGICLFDASSRSEVSGYELSTVVLEGDRGCVDEYLDSKMWQGKAGAFSIQDGSPIRARVLSGEEDNVMGLPMTLLRRLFPLLGYRYPADTPSRGIS